MWIVMDAPRRVRLTAQSHVRGAHENVLGLSEPMKRTATHQKSTAQAAPSRRKGRKRQAQVALEAYAVKLGARMRDLRLERQLSLAGLRQVGGLTPSQMSSAERGLVQVTMGTVAAVARALGLPVFFLMLFPEEDPLAAVLEEIRRRYGADLPKASRILLQRLFPRGAKRRTQPPK
jgi:transcriptional regulator with XRE-family HTH domain